MNNKLTVVGLTILLIIINTIPYLSLEGLAYGIGGSLGNFCVGGIISAIVWHIKKPKMTNLTAFNLALILSIIASLISKLKIIKF